MNTLTVDARGLSCPQPVVETKRAAQKNPSGSIEVLVDTVTSRENVARFGRNEGWMVTTEETLDGHKVILKK